MVWFRCLLVSVLAASTVPVARGQDVRSDEPAFDCESAIVDLKAEMRKHWPKNRLVRFVFHGHSVPAGYFNTPQVRRYDSYPTIFHQALCDRFGTVPIDLCVTAIGGEHSEQGAARFDRDVLSIRPDVVFIDYAMNDRGIGLPRSMTAWTSMIEKAKAAGVPVFLLTPTPTSREDILDDTVPLAQHARQIRGLADEHNVPLIDAYAKFKSLVADGAKVGDFLSHPVHPNRKGHDVVAAELLMRWIND